MKGNKQGNVIDKPPESKEVMRMEWESTEPLIIFFNSSRYVLRFWVLPK